jgi:hypothetical protein
MIGFETRDNITIFITVSSFGESLLKQQQLTEEALNFKSNLGSRLIDKQLSWKF